MTEDKTPSPEKSGGGQDPNDMGGPAFHPEIDKKNSAPDGMEEKGGEKGGQEVDTAEILNEDQIPAITPPDKD